MSDYTLGDTIYHHFTTRAFATGVPTALAGSPTLEIYENDSATPIVEGAGKLVLTQNLNSINGFNLATITATSGNGFEAGKFYTLMLKTGTVGGTSVVGEALWQFTLQASAAAVDLANGTDGLGAIKAAIPAAAPSAAAVRAEIDTNSTQLALIVADTNELQTDWANGGRLDLILDARAAEATLTSMKGATFVEATDSLEALRNRGDAAWTTATGFSTHSAADVWSSVTRTLTAGTNIALAKGVGLTGLNDIAVTDIVSGGAITTSGGAVSSVTLVATATNLTNAPTNGDLTATMKTSVTTAATGVTVDATKINGSTNAAANLARGTLGVVLGTVGAASSTTSIVTSVLDPAAAAVDQFKGRIVTFDRATTTANLRGQSTDITASSALGVLTVTALTDAPVSGDTFTIT